MIVVSLLLILVAVTLLVLGLTGGSSALLISSIVASLLAAVFLVIGARQAAARRRTTGDAAAGEPARDPRGDRDAADDRRRPGADTVLGDGSPSGPRADEARTRTGHPADPRDDPAAGPGDDHPADLREDPAAGPRDDHAADVRDDRAADHPADLPDDAATRVDAADTAGDRGPGRGPGGREEPDYDRASSVIGAARTTADDQSWRRAADSAPPVAQDADEFGEPDADDPADEPLPQAVRPGDAVRMARIDTEVLVVDGRPRYHVADCPHLAGRLTEPLPAREAVELGFSPCGLCRPVDRLVAQAVRH